MKFLIGHNACVNALTIDGWTPLHSAARWNAFESLRILLENGADVNAVSHGGLAPLHLAADTGKQNECLTLLLLHPSIDTTIVNKAGDTALQIASRSGNFTYLFDLAKQSLNSF